MQLELNANAAPPWHYCLTACSPGVNRTDRARVSSLLHPLPLQMAHLAHEVYLEMAAVAAMAHGMVTANIPEAPSSLAGVAGCLTCLAVWLAFGIHKAH
jgi:hypothetical protein